jgi:transposase
MDKREGRTFTEEFKQKAVRLTESSGGTIGQVAGDLGTGLSSLTRWKRQYREADLLAGPHEDTTKERARLRALLRPSFLTPDNLICHQSVTLGQPHITVI